MSWTTTALIVALGIAPASTSGPDHVVAPSVPANLAVPAGHKPFLIARAEGTQNYICLATTTTIAWTFLGPQATLFDDQQGQILTHYLGPNPAESATPRGSTRAIPARSGPPRSPAPWTQTTLRPAPSRGSCCRSWARSTARATETG